MKLSEILTRTMHRILGSAVELESETLTELSSKAVFPGDPALARRQDEARAKLPENSVKRLIEDQKDYPIG